MYVLVLVLVLSGQVLAYRGDTPGKVVEFETKAACEKVLVVENESLKTKIEEQYVMSCVTKAEYDKIK